MTRPDPNRPPTIYDVAREAGVSHQSVSRVLRGVSTTRPDTRAKVQAALARLDYRPNVAARELARSRPQRIGVVGYETFQSSTSMVLRGVNDVAEDAGYRLEIVSVNPVGDVATIADQIEALNSTDVMGILATSPTRNVREALERVKFRMPVFLDGHGDHADSPDPHASRSVSADHVLGHLASLGHRRIAHLAGPTGWDSASRRESVYRHWMKELGEEPVILGRGDWSAASGHRVISEAHGVRDVTAIFVANDRMALGALRALSEQGLSVPGDVSVTGIDDIPESAFFSPPLTTVNIDFASGGRTAAQSLISLIETPDQPLPTYPSPTLVVRASTDTRH